jgi:hypothetical protein
MPRKEYGTPDAENPDITADEVRRGRPGHEVLPELFTPEGGLKVPIVARRGPQKAPTKN